MALLSLGRFDAALASLDDEIADDAHRFGAALRELGRLQYLCDCSAFERARELAPHVIAEAHHLSRQWMLHWISNLLAGCARYVSDDPALLEGFEALVEETGVKGGRTSAASIALAHGDIEGASQLARHTTPADGTDRGLRQTANVIELSSFVLIEAGEWQRAKELLDSVIPTVQSAKMREIEWRLGTLQARALQELGDGSAAKLCMESAREIQQQIATTIADERHRETFLHGRIAARLGI